MTLQTILENIDWAANVSNFCPDGSGLDTLTRGCQLVAIWHHEIAFQNHNNLALPFLHEMKASFFSVPACFSLGLYKPGAASMRAALENALYFSYFSTHTSELNTLLGDPKYYISKKDILEYHRAHTDGFWTKQKDVGFISEIDLWYSQVSAIIHGQIPGIWSSVSLSDTRHKLATKNAALKLFSRASSLINVLFLLSIDSESWEGFSSEARKLFLKGYSNQKKAVIGRPII